MCHWKKKSKDELFKGAVQKIHKNYMEKKIKIQRRHMTKIENEKNIYNVLVSLYLEPKV